MTELELLQQKHREDAAARREQFKERKRRAHRLIERGAMLESAIRYLSTRILNRQADGADHLFCDPEPGDDCIHYREGTRKSLLISGRRAHLLPTLAGRCAVLRTTGRSRKFKR